MVKFKAVHCMYVVLLFTTLIACSSCINRVDSFGNSFATDSVLDANSETTLEREGNARTEQNDISHQRENISSAFQYKTVSLLDGKIEIDIPESFTVMTEEKIAIKYVNSRSRPDIVYTNDNTTVNIALNYTIAPVRQSEVPEVKEALTKQLQQSNPSEFSSSIEKINGASFAVFEFVSQAIDTKVHNLIFASDVDGKLLVGTINYTEKLKDTWQVESRRILKSIKKME